MSRAVKYLVPFNRPRMRFMFCCGYAFFTVTPFNFRASMHKRIPPFDFLTAMTGFSHAGFETRSIIPLSNILCISFSISAWTYGDITYCFCLIGAASPVSMRCLTNVVQFSSPSGLENGNRLTVSFNRDDCSTVSLCAPDTGDTFGVSISLTSTFAVSIDATDLGSIRNACQKSVPKINGLVMCSNKYVRTTLRCPSNSYGTSTHAEVSRIVPSAVRIWLDAAKICKFHLLTRVWPPAPRTVTFAPESSSPSRNSSPIFTRAYGRLSPGLNWYVAATSANSICISSLPVSSRLSSSVRCPGRSPTRRTDGSGRMPSFLNSCTLCF